MLRRNSTRSAHKRPLGRSKSTNSIARRSVTSHVSIDSALAERDAHIAANLSYHRAHCYRRHVLRTACPCQDSGQSMLRRSASVDGRLERKTNERTKKKQSVRFTGPTAKPRRQLASRAKPVLRDSSAAIVDDASRAEWDDALSAPRTPLLGTDKRNSLRKSKSMCNQSTRTTPSYGGSYAESVSVSVQQYPDVSPSPPIQAREDEQLQYSIKRSLRAPKSMSYLDFQMNQTVMEDIETKRYGFLSPVKEYSSKGGSFHRLKSHSSMFFRGKHRRQESSMETSRSCRNSSGHSAALSSVVSGSNMVPLEKSSGIRFTARRVSRNVKHKLSKLFGRSKSTDAKGNETAGHVLHGHDTDSESCSHPANNSPSVEEASISRVASHVPSLHAVPSYQQMRSRQGSLESIQYEEQVDVDQKSRITSWTNSTANTIVSYEANEEREFQRLSVIKENGMHVPSSSRTESREEPTHGARRPNVVIDSQRVYSALMKKLKSDISADGSPKRPDCPKQVSLRTVPPRQSSLDRADAWSPRTVRGIGTDEDDVFEDSKEYASLRIPSSSVSNKLEALCEDTGTSASYKAYPHPTAGDGKGLSPDCKPCIIPSPSSFLFRTTSPYRRALQRSIQEQQENGHTHALDTRYLSTLSALTLPTRCPSTLGSERDVRLTYAESFYSFTSEDLTSSYPPEATSKPILEEDVEEAQQPETACITETPLQCRDISSASSVEWKTWLSAHVSKLEAPQHIPTTAASPGVGAAVGSVTSVGHVRESAEIESPADVPKSNAGQTTPTIRLMEGNVNGSTSPSEKTRASCPGEAGGTATTSSNDVENRGKLLHDEEIEDNGTPLVPPPIPYRNVLRTVTSLPNVENEAASNSVKGKKSLAHRRSLNNIPTWLPLTQDGTYHKRRDQENERRDPPSSKKSTPGLNCLDAKTGGSPFKHKIKTPNPPQTPAAGPAAVFGPGNVPDTVKSEWDAQIRGSRRMVDLFLSSRRKAIQGPMSRNGSDNFSAAFL